MKTLKNRYESLVALALAGLALITMGAALNILCRLFLAGWHTADFLFRLFFSNT